MAKKREKQGLGASLGKISCKETFNAIKNLGNFGVVVHVPQTSQYLVISRFCFAAKYNDPKRACRAIVQLIKPFVW